MAYTYEMQGTCAHQVSFELQDGCVHNVHFLGGCQGNLLAIGKLVEGMRAEAVIERLAGNTCGMKRTSCADQFARALQAAIVK